MRLAAARDVALNNRQQGNMQSKSFSICQLIGLVWIGSSNAHKAPGLLELLLDDAQRQDAQPRPCTVAISNSKHFQAHAGISNSKHLHWHWLYSRVTPTRVTTCPELHTSWLKRCPRRLLQLVLVIAPVGCLCPPVSHWTQRTAGH